MAVHRTDRQHNERISVATRCGYHYIRVISSGVGRNYNFYYRVSRINDINLKKLKEFVRGHKGDFYGLISALYKSGEFENDVLESTYNNLFGKQIEEGISADFEEGFFKKKACISAHCSSVLESEFRDIVRRENENGFSLIKKNIKRRSYPKKEYIEYTGFFTRTSFPQIPPVVGRCDIETKDKIEKWLIVSDLHIPYENKNLLHAILDMCESENIKNLVINGDLIDFDFISSYERNSSQLSQNYIEESMASALGWVDLFASSFQQKVFIEGNHDDRIRRNTLGDNIRAFIPSMHPDERMRGVPYNSVSGLFLMPIKGFKCFSYGDVFVIGDYQIHHGQEVSKSIQKDRVYYNSIIGHTHRSEIVYNPVYTNNGYMVNKKVRCGCLIDFKKHIPASTQKAKENWVNGFAVLTQFDNRCGIENIVCDGRSFMYRDRMWKF